MSLLKITSTASSLSLSPLAWLCSLSHLSLMGSAAVEPTQFDCLSPLTRLRAVQLSTLPAGALLPQRLYGLVFCENASLSHMIVTNQDLPSLCARVRTRDLRALLDVRERKRYEHAAPRRIVGSCCGKFVCVRACVFGCCAYFFFIIFLFACVWCWCARVGTLEFRTLLDVRRSSDGMSMLHLAALWHRVASVRGLSVRACVCLRVCVSTLYAVIMRAGTYMWFRISARRVFLFLTRSFSRSYAPRCAKPVRSSSCATFSSAHLFSLPPPKATPMQPMRSCALALAGTSTRVVGAYRPTHRCRALSRCAGGGRQKQTKRASLREKNNTDNSFSTPFLWPADVFPLDEPEAVLVEARACAASSADATRLVSLESLAARHTVL